MVGDRFRIDHRHNEVGLRWLVNGHAVSGQATAIQPQSLRLNLAGRQQRQGHPG